MQEPPPAKRPGFAFLFKAAAVLAAAVVVAVMAARGVHLGELLDRFGALVARVGPWAFFAGMAILPAFGMPATAFTLTAGTAFGARMGMGGVVAAGVAAISVNIALSYWLARRVLRRGVAWLVARLGHKLPEVESDDMTDLIVLLRVTPGVPLVVQNYLLGLAEAPVGRYFAISYAISWPMTAAYLWFGDALRQGKGATILTSLLAIAALTAAMHLARRHYAGRKATA